MAANCPDAAQHPGNDYYVQGLTGTIQQQSNSLLAKVMTGPGGYVGPFDWCDAKAYAAHNTVSGTANNPGSSAIAHDIPGVGNIDDFINFIKQGSIWTRVGEFAVGAILLYIGIKALASGTAVGNAANSAKNTGKKIGAVIPK